MVHQQALEMGVAVIFACPVMAVLGAKGRELLQPLVNIFDETGFIVIHINSGGDVHGSNQRHAFFDSAFFHRRLHLRRDVNILAMFPGIEGEVLGKGLHEIGIPQTKTARSQPGPVEKYSSTVRVRMSTGSAVTGAGVTRAKAASANPT